MVKLNEIRRGSSPNWDGKRKDRVYKPEPVIKNNRGYVSHSEQQTGVIDPRLIFSPCKHIALKGFRLSHHIG